MIVKARKDLTFSPRNELDELRCQEHDHEWKVLLFVSDEQGTPGMSICKICAKTASGWVKYND